MGEPGIKCVGDSLFGFGNELSVSSSESNGGLKQLIKYNYGKINSYYGN